MNIDFLKIAIEEAKVDEKEIPVGCVIAKDNEVIAITHNQKEAFKDATLHAEIIAIKKASKKLSNWRLNGCDMYVTLEPCPMCLSAIIQSRISNLYFGAYDYCLGGISTNLKLIELYNSPLKVQGGFLENDCKMLLDEYFKRLR